MSTLRNSVSVFFRDGTDFCDDHDKTAISVDPNARYPSANHYATEICFIFYKI